MSDRYTFNTYATGSLDMESKFAGAAAIVNKVVFAPFNSNEIRIFDTGAEEFSTPDTTGDLTMGGKFFGAAAVGTKVVFAPHNANVVGVFDTGAEEFSTPATTEDLIIDMKFFGAAAVGNKVVFAPYDAGKVGVFDTGEEKFSTHATHMGGKLKFSGATAIPDERGFVNHFKNKVVFAPFDANKIGVFDTVEEKFSTPATTGDLDIDGKFSGAAAVGTKVVFAPYNADVVGVFDIATNKFSTYDIPLDMNGKFSGAAADGDTVVFAPFNAGGIGLFDTKTVTFNFFIPEDSKDLFKQEQLFNGAVTVGDNPKIGNKVVFAPYNADVVAVLDVLTPGEEGYDEAQGLEGGEQNLTLIIGLALGIGIPILIIIIVLIVKDPANVIYKNK